MDLETLKQKILKTYPGADLSLVESAYEFASQAHAGQFRRSGEAYIQHPLEVAAILADLQMDATTVAAALLHDVVEDCSVCIPDLETRFGKEVASLVDGVTKLSRLDFTSREEAQLENLRKMFLAMARDLRVILIKLADRLHNMRTLGYLREDKQRSIAQETLEIYAPLAHRLGMADIKWELEDLAFRYMEPEKYREIARLVAQKREERESLTQELMAQLRQKLDEVGIKADISGRPKHLYSIYKKMYRQGKDITELYDLIAIRVIVDEVKDCYGALGVIHSFWRPLPGRFKDYIATPKPNLYQSLHTTVVGPHGQPFEIQIRTWDMHRTAEYGVAAHWRYKEGRTDPDFDRKLSWLRSLLEWHTEMREARDFVEAVKVDIFADQVFVFTPKGHVVDLPAGATPIDFAYAIHTDIGHRCVGARVNGKLTPLDTPLKSGDIVEILTSKSSPGPSIDWLKIVKTSTAKNKIRQFFKRERREEDLQRGREALDREIRRLGYEPHELLKDEWLAEVRKKHNLASDDELLVAIGIGTLTASTVAGRLRDLFERERQRAEGVAAVTPPPATERKEWEGYRKPSSGIHVKGVDGVLVRFSRCCSPVPGDPIIGYVTRGRGVAVHRLDCPNLPAMARDPDRLIEVGWEEGYSASHPVEIQIVAIDRAGLLAEVAGIVADSRINVLSSMSRGHRNKLATIDMVLEVRDLTQLQYVLQKIRKVRDVLSADRVVHENRARGSVGS
ncbi:RelA/SpoT family protein [Caldinitratiruptor microaerophilus]|uniref:GTP diphosphokinase n=1 Tax=Caldinitratiruptor microaerophilus TaxID=671077 RepID=A0AA35CKN5_9FIRM|nr:bifunctional (p)ppGpp synthetase/guanosine-3',5'-bis(diphosphate) 3'-pyrophosphohydrolase [Caldinitratiruptor microaerophilus]BDG59277.1 (p)ppGpp synthetase [Caldinitratiruptor microaerophilus]